MLTFCMLARLNTEESQVKAADRQVSGEASPLIFMPSFTLQCVIDKHERYTQLLEACFVDVKSFMRHAMAAHLEYIAPLKVGG